MFFHRTSLYEELLRRIKRFLISTIQSNNKLFSFLGVKTKEEERKYFCDLDRILIYAINNITSKLIMASGNEHLPQTIILIPISCNLMS